MYIVQDALSPYVWPFFYSLTFFVSIFALNLCLAVIEQTYSISNDEVTDGDEEVFWVEYDEEYFYEIFGNEIIDCFGLDKPDEDPEESSEIKDLEEIRRRRTTASAEEEQAGMTCRQVCLPFSVFIYPLRLDKITQSKKTNKRDSSR